MKQSLLIKDLKKISGIYAIINKINNKIYIGSSCDIGGRIYWHLNYLKNNRHHNDKLQNAWNKYGKDNFYINIVYRDIDIKDLEKYEQFVMDLFNVTEDGYNIALKADRSEMSQETKDKISKSLKGRKRNKESIEKTRFTLIGQKRSEDSKNKMSLSGLKRAGITYKFKDMVIQMFLDGTSVKDINKSLKISIWTIRSILDRYNIKKIKRKISNAI